MTEYRKIGEAAYSRPGLTTYIENGVLKEATSNVPVFEGSGLRVWGQVTNRNPLSNEFNATMYTSTGSILEYDLPDISGGNSALKQAASQELSSHQFNANGVSFNDGDEICWSVIVSADGQYSVLSMENGNFSQHETRGNAQFDLDSGSVMSVTTGVGSGTMEASIKSIGGGVYIASLYGAKKAGDGTVNLYCQVRQQQNQSTFEGDGVSGLIYYAIQASTSSIPTPYIPTNGQQQ